MEQNKIVTAIMLVAAIIIIAFFIVGATAGTKSIPNTGLHQTDQQVDISTLDSAPSCGEKGVYTTQPSEVFYETESKAKVACANLCKENGGKYQSILGDSSSGQYLVAQCSCSCEGSPRIEIDKSILATPFKLGETRTVTYKIYRVLHNSKYDIRINEKIFDKNNTQYWANFDAGEKTGTSEEFVVHGFYYTAEVIGKYTIQISVYDYLSKQTAFESAELENIAQ
ncbi:MAG: hypothetical protein WCW13_01530 [archaeon]|jgi:hypothetical protein